MASTGGAVLRLRLIGQMGAWTGEDESVLPAGRKTRALLAVIALSAPRPALRGRLADLLWSRRPEEQARASLRQEIHRLLETLSVAGSEIIVVTRDHLSLRPGAVWTDVDEVMGATTAAPSSLSLLDGDLLEDLDGIDATFDAWLTTERERLRDRARTVAEALLREQADPEAAIPAAHRLLSIDRAHEGAWRALMRAHADRGERGMAIQAYDRCRAVLADMLDAGPSPETQKLLVEIRGPSGSRLPARPSARPAEPTPVVAGSEPEPAQPAGWQSASAADSVAPGEPEPAQAAIAPHAPRDGIRVGVVPPQFVGTAGDDAALAAGLAEEITAALSRFSGLQVVASSALARFAEKSRDEQGIQRTFDIDFLLDGTIQRSGKRLRVSLRLLDLRAGNHVAWARRFDREGDDLLALQDDIAAEAVAQIDGGILLAESQRAVGSPLTSVSAYDLVRQALPLMARLDRESFMQAGRLLTRAVRAEPDAAAAHAWHAWWHTLLIGQSWADDAKAATDAASELAERAVMLDPFDARALAIAGRIRAYLHRRPREAAPLHERALALNPNLPMAWALSAAACAWMGDIQSAEARAQRYKVLSPFDPYAGLFDGVLTLIHLLKRDHEAAVAAGRAQTQMAPMLSAGFKPYLAALGHLGHLQEATAARRRLLAIEPHFTVQRYSLSSPLESDEDRQHVAQGLRLAGIPETDSPTVAPVTQLRQARS